MSLLADAISALPIDSGPAEVGEQERIRLPLPIVEGNKDYREKVALLQRMDEILRLSGVEATFVAELVAAVEVEQIEAKGKPLSDRRRATVQNFAHQTLRCVIARILSNESLRIFSIHLAESSLLQWFCRCATLRGIKVPSKSTLQRMEESVSADSLRRMVVSLVASATGVDASGDSTLGLAEPVDLSTVWMDSTCAKLDIHYPNDWALLRDGVRSIMQTILVIRSHGLFHRMSDPAGFIARMNSLSIQMGTLSRRGRGADKKRERKRILREMKRLTGKVIGHGKRYAAKLRAEWASTDLSEAQARNLWERLETLIALLPQAARQAHERIIGERQVPNDQKILSLYQPHAQVYVRGKAGADAEFGLQMNLTESAEGLILDCRLTDDRVASDCDLLIPTLESIREAYGLPAANGVVTDGGFASADNSAVLKAYGITDWTMPRSPTVRARRMQDGEFRRLQRRRAQTEARIGLFKANFVGDRIPTKNRAAQHRYVAWAMFAHNLWLLARLDQVERADIEAA